MKKHLISFLAILLAAVLALTSCGGDSELIAELESQIEDLQGELDEVREDTAKKDQEIGKLKDDNSSKDQEISSLKTEIKKLQDEIAALESKDAENLAKIAELEAKIQELINNTKYTVTFDFNDGKSETLSQTIKYGKTVDEPESPEKDHYKFMGWYVEDTKAEFPYAVTNDLDFIAVYEPIKYTITYNANGGTMPDTYVSEYTVETSVTLPIPTRSLYVFEGWYEDAKFEGERVTEISLGDYGNKAYYAKWVEATSGIIYQLAGSGTYYMVTGYEGSDTVIVIPGSIDGIPVTMIANDAFNGNQKVTSIIIPDSITEIGDAAFKYCDSLQSVVIPDSVIYIGDYAFSYCTGLTGVVIGEGIVSISNDVFSGCKNLTHIEVSENNRYYKSIDDNLYSKGGKTLIQYAIGKKDTSFAIPDGVIIIGDWAFSDCDNLQSVVIPDGVTTIGNGAFAHCASLRNVVIPDSVTIIRSYAFRSCSSLRSAVIGDSVFDIGDSAFGECVSLTSLVIGESVTSIGNDAFSYCTYLYVIYNNSDVILEMNSTNNGYVARSAKIIVDNGVATYTDDVYEYTLTDDGFLFRNKDSKYELIAYIGSEETVTLPESINDSSYEIYQMRGVVNVIIPDSFTALSNYAFTGCTSLVCVVLPDSITSIGEGALRNCKNLTSIEVSENNQYYKSIDGSLYNKDGKALIQYAIGKNDTSFEIPDSVTSIDDYAFYYSTRLQSVKIPDSVESIGNWAFASCHSLTSVMIPDSLTSIGDYVFIYCTGLQSIVIPDSIKSIGNGAFSECSSLTSVVIPDSVTSIYSSAFAYCTGITSVVIGSSVTSINHSAFYSCDSLTDVYYNGTEAEWNTMYIANSTVSGANGNYKLVNATRYYYSETESTKEGNFWHWGENGEVVVWE